MAGSKTKSYANRPRVKDDQELPFLRPKSQVAAFFAADLHFCHKPPIARSAEEDWYEVQKGYLKQLQKYSQIAPIVIAGDVFDKWNVPPELINLLLKYMPQVYAVPGQHDLPNHDYGQLHRSAYGTLVEAGKIINLEPGHPVEVPGWHPIRLWGFPWGFEIKPPRQPDGLVTDIAVVHAFVWKDEATKHQGATDEQSAISHKKKLKGYDAAVFGDNHCPFTIQYKSGFLLHNCGGFMRRRIDEIDHKPSVGMLQAEPETGKLSIVREYLNVSEDKFIDEEIASTLKQGGMEDLIHELTDLADVGIDFDSALRRTLDNLDVPIIVKEHVLSCLEGKEK